MTQAEFWQTLILGITGLLVAAYTIAAFAQTIVTNRQVKALLGQIRINEEEKQILLDTLEIERERLQDERRMNEPVFRIESWQNITTTHEGLLTIVNCGAPIYDVSSTDYKCAFGMTEKIEHLSVWERAQERIWILQEGNFIPSSIMIIEFRYVTADNRQGRTRIEYMPLEDGKVQELST